ncbi:uncharacterized protein LOC108664468 [Hyalella azteca]|uniref:Uncharacterized protein LOC108664468 n=1 Tax=Hyalella azteca TaxID=294128 RepID=A0A8B7MYA4_HYAAZ|nr:uncharacterized protein LOC108664468 [Hyalella azteca]
MKRNRCSVHNLLKRSLGFPYQLSWTEDEYVSPPPPSLNKPSFEPAEGEQGHYGVPETIESIPIFHNGFVPKSKDLPTMKSSCPTVKNTNASNSKASRGVGATGTIGYILPLVEKPVCKPCLPRIIKSNAFKCFELQCPIKINKIFCCAWISDHEVIMGTKCHQLILYDSKLNLFRKIPELTPCNGSTSDCPGIRCVKCNPKGNLLATVGRCGNQVTLYTLPSMKHLLVVTDNEYSNWIFDMCWLSDSKLAAAGREGRVSIWNFESLFMPSEENLRTTNSIHASSKNLSIVQDIKSSYSDDHSTDMTPPKFCEVSFKPAGRARAVVYNGADTLFVLSTSGSVYSYNTVTCDCNWRMSIPGGSDNTCMAYCTNLKLLAVGSASCVFFIEDCGAFPHISEVELPTADNLYIRSLAFHDQTLSIGTGAGQLLFVDLSEFWSGKMAYYRTRYLFPRSQHPERDQRLLGHVDPRRTVFSYVPAMEGEQFSDHLCDPELCLRINKIDVFDRPLEETFFTITNSLQKKLGRNYVTKEVEQHYEQLDAQCRGDESEFIAVYSRRKITFFESCTFLTAAEDRAHLVSTDSKAVYAQSYNPNTGQFFVAGGPISLMNEGAFCAILR